MHSPNTRHQRLELSSNLWHNINVSEAKTETENVLGHQKTGIVTVRRIERSIATETRKKNATENVAKVEVEAKNVERETMSENETNVIAKQIEIENEIGTENETVIDHALEKENANASVKEKEKEPVNKAVNWIGNN